MVLRVMCFMMTMRSASLLCGGLDRSAEATTAVATAVAAVDKEIVILLSLQ